MRIAVFSTKPYDQRALEEAHRRHRHELVFFETRLTPDTAALELGFDAVCPFVNDLVSADANIAETTLANATAFENGVGEIHRVSLEEVLG